MDVEKGRRRRARREGMLVEEAIGDDAWRKYGVGRGVKGLLARRITKAGRRTEKRSVRGVSVGTVD